MSTNYTKILKYIEEQILEFWKCSETRNMNFDFNRFFKEFSKVLEIKLSLHGVLGFNNYLKYQDRNYDMNLLKHFEYFGYIVPCNDDYDKIAVRIFNPRYKKFYNHYKNDEMYKNIKNLYRKINKSIKNFKVYNIKENVFLVDECIHVIHNSGNLIDIDKLERQYEKLNIHNEVK